MINNRFKLNLFIVEHCVLIELITFGAYFVLHLIRKYILYFPIQLECFSKSIVPYIDASKIINLVVAVIFLIVILIFSMKELIWRLSHDSLRNLFKSIRLTYELRRFMIRQSNHNGESTVKISSYNKAVKSLIVDFNKKEFVVKMKTAIDLEGQKLLEADLEKLREQIAVNTTDYHTSLFERKGKYWLCAGSKI